MLRLCSPMSSAGCQQRAADTQASNEQQGDLQLASARAAHRRRQRGAGGKLAAPLARAQNWESRWLPRLCNRAAGLLAQPWAGEAGRRGSCWRRQWCRCSRQPPWASHCPRSATTTCWHISCERLGVCARCPARCSVLARVCALAGASPAPCSRASTDLKHWRAQPVAGRWRTPPAAAPGGAGHSPAIPRLPPPCRHAPASPFATPPSGTGRPARATPPAAATAPCECGRGRRVPWRRARAPARARPPAARDTTPAARSHALRLLIAHRAAAGGPSLSRAPSPPTGSSRTPRRPTAAPAPAPTLMPG